MQMQNIERLDQGFYTVPEAARLLGVADQKVRGWVAGYPRTRAAPIVKTEIGWADGRLGISFINLMELRFISAFANLGVRVASIRGMAAEAQEFLNHPHPFATETIFKTDGRSIFAQTAKVEDDPGLYDLKAKNWAMYGIIAQSLYDDVVFVDGMARAWHPRRHDAPDVVVTPSMAFGRPVLQKHGIPTRALFEAYRAEGETVETVALWYDVSANDVHEAIKFETLLRAA